MCMCLCWPFKRNIDCADVEVGIDIRIYRRMQYLYEMHVPLRYRWIQQEMNWEMVLSNYKNITFDIDYFRNDEKLQVLLSFREK